MPEERLKDDPISIYRTATNYISVLSTYINMTQLTIPECSLSSRLRKKRSGTEAGIKHGGLFRYTHVIGGIRVTSRQSAGPFLEKKHPPNKKASAQHPVSFAAFEPLYFVLFLIIASHN